MYKFVCVFLVTVVCISEILASNRNFHINKKERFSRTRFLVSQQNLASKPATDNFFNWNLNHKTPNAFLKAKNVSQDDSPFRVSLKLSETTLKRTKKPKRLKGKQRAEKLNKNKKRRLKKLKQIYDSTTVKSQKDVFVWKLRNSTGLVASMKKSESTINPASENSDKNVLIETTTNSYDTQASVQSTSRIPQHADAGIFKKEAENKRKLENALGYDALPKINQAVESGNVSMESLLNELSLLYPQLKKKKLSDNRKDTVFSKSLKSRCSFFRGGCDHFCHDSGPKLCSCLEGFNLEDDGRSCKDINECQISNGNCQHLCYNTPGSYYCQCPRGLRISNNLRSCEDINECLLRNGHGPCQNTCQNTYGSYICSCIGLKGTQLSHDGHSCKDIDECQEGKSGCTHGCVNTLGRSFCTCPDGWELAPDWKTCLDINECQDEAISRQCKHGCRNTIGSYNCADPPQMQSDQTYTPGGIVCPPLFPPKHGYLQCSREKGAPFSKAPSGRNRITNRPGTFCELICPKGLKTVGDFRITCTQQGTWEGERTGSCEPLARPKIVCPDSKIIHLTEEEDRAYIALRPPKTNVDWKHVEAFPRWAKDLHANLLPGHHPFTFVATDPESLFSDSCSFHVIVKKPNYT